MSVDAENAEQGVFAAASSLATMLRLADEAGVDAGRLGELVFTGLVSGGLPHVSGAGVPVRELAEQLAEAAVA